MTLEKALKTSQKAVDKALGSLLPKSSKRPSRIHEAMRYSMFAGGKRLRPFLVMEAARLCGGKAKAVVQAACAMEMIHTYSLIHDDLPAMDNDDLRRGKPTNHKVFGEDMAILAGDALLTLSFKLLSMNAYYLKIKTENFYRLINETVVGAGTEGMIGGQVADILSDKGRWEKIKNPKEELRFIHTHKTAALIQSSLLIGGILANASTHQLTALNRFGMELGLLFQITDDILDKTGDKRKLGKNGSDQKNNKLTFLSLYGLTQSLKMADYHATKAKLALKPFKQNASLLIKLIDHVRNRDH